MIVGGTGEVGTDPMLRFAGRQQACWLDDVPFAVDHFSSIGLSYEILLGTQQGAMRTPPSRWTRWLSWRSQVWIASSPARGVPTDRPTGARSDPGRYFTSYVTAHTQCLGL